MHANQLFAFFIQLTVFTLYWLSKSKPFLFVIKIWHAWFNHIYKVGDKNLSPVSCNRSKWCKRTIKMCLVLPFFRIFYQNYLFYFRQKQMKIMQSLSKKFSTLHTSSFVLNNPFYMGICSRFWNINLYRFFVYRYMNTKF